MTKKIITSFISIFFILFFTDNLFAQTKIRRVSEEKKDYRLLKEAQNFFESGDYAHAISYAEEAKESRILECNYNTYVLQNIQRHSYVRKAGDYISDLLDVLKDHSQNEAYNLINFYFEKYGRSTFKNSYSYLLTFIEEHKEYPEADFLLGKIYRLEGENKLAESYYLRAYENEKLLDVNDVKYEILYELSDLSSYSDDKSEYEKYLLLILSESKFYKNDSFMNALVRLVKQNKGENVEKLFIMYRSDEYYTIKALNLLSIYYLQTNDLDKALKCACLGSITGITRIEEILKDRMIFYKYENFSDMLQKASKYADINRWANNNGLWNLIFNLGQIAEDSDSRDFSRELFTLLSENPCENYYQEKAKIKISQE